MRRALSLLLLVVSLPVLAERADTATVQGWLQRMVQAVHRLNYDGTFVYLHDNHLETIRVIHRAGPSGERERLISLNGAAREVVRDDASVTCIAPDTRSITVGRRVTTAFRAIFSMDAEKLSSYYDFQSLGETRIAGRPAKVVAIVPRDGYRYGYRLYLDQKTYLPLKSDMIDEKGNLVSQVMFTSLEIRQETTAGLDEPSLEGKEDYHWVNQRSMYPMPGGGEEGWRFEGLPAGYRVGLYAHSSENRKQPDMDHIVLSDGLASVSVYVEPAGSGPGLQGAARMGAISAYGRQLDGFQVTVVGEVPMAMVERVAAAIRPGT
ncbi:MAG TPA: transcriptional regulator [Sedimenticola sp.]|nr:transcriptional regulator [Sedimenticola sp.]